MLVTSKLTDRLRKKDVGIDLIKFRQLVAGQHDIVGGYDYAPGGVKKRNSFQATAFQSFAVS